MHGYMEWGVAKHTLPRPPTLASCSRHALPSHQHPDPTGESTSVPLTVLLMPFPAQESGPTLCGDELSDPALMDQLGASLVEDSNKTM